MVFNYYWRWPNILPEKFCDLVLEDLDWTTADAAKIGLENQNNHYERVADVLWLNPMTLIGNVAQAYTQYANVAAGWHYDINAFENVQMSRYRSGKEAGHFKMHKDMMPPVDGVQRKLTCVVMLSDPSSDFKGGELQIEGVEENNLLDTKGSVIVFPSFLNHVVHPVTKGTRYTAVLWAHGPSFR